MTFGEFISGRTPGEAQAATIVDPRAALEAEFTELLAGYLAEHRSLTPWDRHCLANATRLMCMGDYGRAFEQITQVRSPPVPLQFHLRGKG